MHSFLNETNSNYKIKTRNLRFKREKQNLGRKIGILNSRPRVGGLPSEAGNGQRIESGVPIAIAWLWPDGAKDSSPGSPEALG